MRVVSGLQTQQDTLEDSRSQTLAFSLQTKKGVIELAVKEAITTSQTKEDKHYSCKKRKMYRGFEDPSHLT